MKTCRICRTEKHESDFGTPEELRLIADWIERATTIPEGSRVE